MLGVLLSLDDLIDGRRAIVEGDERVDFDAADVASLAPDMPAVLDLLEELSQERSDAGLEELVFSQELSEVALAHALDMYGGGYFSHVSPTTGRVGDRVARAVSYQVAGENLALAADATEAHDGLVASPSHYENMINPAFGSVGVAALDGPLGLMVVQVFTG